MTAAVALLRPAGPPASHRTGASAAACPDQLRTRLATELHYAAERTGDGRFLAAARLLQEPRPSDSSAERDRAIRAAAALLDGSGRARARAVLAEAQIYATIAWRFHRSKTSCPDEIRGTIREHLWRAMKAHSTFPTGWRQIFSIIAG